MSAAHSTPTTGDAWITYLSSPEYADRLRADARAVTVDLSDEQVRDHMRNCRWMDEDPANAPYLNELRRVWRERMHAVRVATPFSPEWHEAQTGPVDQAQAFTRYDRIMGAVVNGAIGALMATIGWRA